MAQLLEASTEGYEDAIVVPEITANNFEIKHGLLNLVQNKQFFRHDKEDPHAHIRYFNKITSTMKFPNVPSTSVKLMLFPFSLEGARTSRGCYKMVPEARILHRYTISTALLRRILDPYLIILIMPPRRFKKKSVRKIVEKRVAKAIEKYEKTRADSNNTGGSGSTNTGGTVVPEMHGCSYKTFMNGKPHSFKGTEGVVGLKRWFEKMEQVVEICKCAEDDKVKFAMCTFEGRALTWWNGNVQTLGLTNAN
ncbi:hypothetical protein Tco_0708946 [Tanacetum coccineum]